MLQLQFNFTKKLGKEAISLWKNVLEKSIKLRSTNNDTKINNISSHWKGIFEAASKPPSIRYCNRQVPLNSLIHPFLPTQQLSNTRTATAQSRPTGEWPASLLNSLGKAPGSFFLPLHLHLPVSRKTFIRQVSPIPLIKSCNLQTPIQAQTYPSSPETSQILWDTVAAQSQPRVFSKTQTEAVIISPREDPWDTDIECKNWIRRQSHCLHQLMEEMREYIQ